MNIIIAMMSLINEDILATIIGTSSPSLLNNHTMDSQIKIERKHKIVNTTIFDLFKYNEARLLALFLLIKLIKDTHVLNNKIY